MIEAKANQGSFERDLTLNPSYLRFEEVGHVFQTKNGPFEALSNINLEVAQGEFICVVGHSGCGKSTLLNMVSGFLNPTSGRVILNNLPIEGPGPDRMVVFQNYSLLPWKTVDQNVSLAVKAARPDLDKGARAAVVEHHLEMVGLIEARHKRPVEISGGMRQRVAIARALAVQPAVLVLDEPFGALDAITKEELQEELLAIWREHKPTVLMITHDIDEALFLADRIVMMTNGPSATIGEIMEVPFNRPRDFELIQGDPRYGVLRNHALDFLYRRYAHDDA
ncbi:ATP-binding cassette domain-containing protein [Cyanobium sp. HWJ4-Hawea]|uniref:ABC transporter ATP-binding protein n=1 Tax=unclassified Cyanobium TaxID=2627006 RepID=UPI0020CBA135|nr:MULTISPECIES: nitrate ABC transporter ATP-binding protein [unclassified Cyanobium]MCP9775505.1 ATP-binding cassette domain-containing protein [Cyanobium sp. WAJ14-Wanaka]MCP9809020.1 ATP-binding cassette domain-containing protein [Cyanobium sp. HWJ4-Hawea]